MQIDRNPAGWRARLRPGAIVAFAFPSSENDKHLEKHRPCLVLDIHAETGEATVVYGTGAWTDANTGRELRITRPADLAAASLRKPTRFVGARRLRVPLTSPRFVEGAAGTAVIGHLPPALAARLDRVRTVPSAPRRKVRFHLRRPRRRPDERDAARHSNSERKTA